VILQANSNTSKQEE